MYINILGSLYLSLGAGIGDQNLSVLLISVMNAVGRMSAGLITDSLYVWYYTVLCNSVNRAHRVKRTAFLAIIYLLFTAVWVYLGTFESLQVLPLTSMAVGFCYGGMWPFSRLVITLTTATLCVLPTITSELFGVCTFAENWGSIQPANAVGNVVLSVVAGILYDRQVCPNVLLNVFLLC